jgi:predicted nucleic acid-binding protein
LGFKDAERRGTSAPRANPMTVLLDTSVLIDILTRRGRRSEFFSKLLQEGHTFACCALTIAEVYAGMKPHEKTATEDLLGGLEYFETPRKTAERAGHLKAVWARKGRALSLPDTSSRRWRLKTASRWPPTIASITRCPN